jgi:hypothetical protein
LRASGIGCIDLTGFMADTETFWGSGVSTQIEFPERVAFHRRFGWGLEVEQEQDTIRRQNNWFHICLPCRSRNHYEGGTIVEAFMLRMRVNENARIAELHLRDGPHLIHARGVNIVDQDILQEFANPTAPPYWIAFPAGASGVTLCVRVEFLSGSPRGRATFYGAGIRLTGLDR